jgi:hypothetical protein
MEHKDNNKMDKELELLSLRMKVKDLKEVVDSLLTKEVSDIEKGRLEGLKNILNR